MRGLALYPQDVELLFRQGMLAHEMGWLNEAVTAYRGALESREDRHFVSIDRCLAGHKTRNNLALVYADQGQHALAEVQWRSIVDIQPHFRPAWRGLGQTLVRQGKLTALELLVEELDKQADGRPDACWLRALAAEKKGDTDQMKSLLEEALKADPNHDSARHDYCRCLFLHGDLREAEAALEELTRRAPDDGAAFHNLGLVYARLEKRDQAIQAFERSLTVRPNSPVTRAELQRIGGVLGSQEPPAAAEGGIATPTLANDDRELPICHSRRALAQTLNAFRCAHPQVHARDNIVTERVCAMCRRWQEPPPPHFRDLQQPSSALRGLDCVFLGPETGVPRCSACRGEVNVKVFACRHPSRSETTLAECRTCADFSACPAADSSLARSEARARHRASHEATGNDRPLDIVYLFCHSPHQDLEILYSLRSVAQHLPYIRKIWIFGDRPNFLSNDTSIVEHVSHDVLAQPLGFHVPVRNDFLMLFLASLIPGLAFDFVKFSDDYIVLQDVPRDRLCTARALEDLNQLPLRGRGVYKDLIWLTYDILKRAGYPGYSFEAHVPQPYTRQVVLDAFQAFRDFVSEDRFAGLLSGTTICNFALKDRAMPFVWLEEEKSKAGFYKSCPPVEEIESACAEKLFLNFSDKMFTEPMVRFLQARFSQPCKYELPSQSPPLASVEETIHMNV